MIRAAADADPEIRQLLRTLDAQRVYGLRLFAEHLATSRLLRRGMTVTKAADVLATHMDSRIYLWLVHDRNWRRRDYEKTGTSRSPLRCCSDRVGEHSNSALRTL